MIPSQTISLNNFEGPLDLLLHLIQKNEIDIYDIHLQTITKQFLETLNSISTTRVDIGAEFLGVTATLLLIKSQKLLPKTELNNNAVEDDPRFMLIQQLLEYCRFKELAKDLSDKEEKERKHFSRGIYYPPISKKDSSYINNVTLEGLEAILREILKRQESKISTVIEGERWYVADKITWIKQELALLKEMHFHQLFSFEKPKAELIVIFLAVLELMKCNEISVLNTSIVLKKN